ncbi:MAG TPA: RidA family protein [Actinomycetota bacterium]|nr:RidA family protein [Actinomycetota bacterium]
MNDADVLARLSSLGLELPSPPSAVAAYVPVVVSDGLAFLAGQVPLVDGKLLHPGRLGQDVSLEQGVEASRRCALQAISALRAALGGTLEGLDRLLKVEVFVASTPAFSDQPKVANGASELLAEVLGEPGKHARVAVGVASLPLGACVEVAVTAAVSA